MRFAPACRVHDAARRFRHFAYRPDAPSCPQLGIVDIEGDLYFGAVNHVEEEIYRLHQRNPEQRFGFCCACARQPRRFQRHPHAGKRRPLLPGAGRRRVSDARRAACPADDERHGLSAVRAPDHLLGKDDAIEQIFYRVLDPAICIYECPVRAFRECQNLPKRDVAVRMPRLREIPEGLLIEITPRELWRQLTDGDPRPTVIDVREPREFHRGHIPARPVPLATILSDMCACPTTGYRAVCQSGGAAMGRLRYPAWASWT